MLILLGILKHTACLIVTWALFAAAPAAAQLLPAGDLAQAAATARAQRAPVLIAFMERSCPYCAIARRDYLMPLQSDPRWRDRVLIREVDVGRNTAMLDFSGAKTTQRAYARSLGIKRVPTLIVFDADGQQAALPITGLLADDFYRLYIEQAIEAGLTRMRKR